MQKTVSDRKSAKEVYYFCYYHVLTVKHRNYHHVVMKLRPDDLDQINTLDCDEYQYRLISAVPISDEEVAGQIIRGLVMDGESLLKRFKAQQKTISS